MFLSKVFNFCVGMICLVSCRQFYGPQQPIISVTVTGFGEDDFQSSNLRGGQARSGVGGWLTREWEAFHGQAQRGISEYLKTEEAQKRVPSKHFQDAIKGNHTKHSKKDVIAAVQLDASHDKLKRLDTYRRFWQGPISLAVRVRSLDELNLFLDYFQNLPTTVTSTWTVHFVFEYAQPEHFPADSYPAQYCHNTLRELAMHSSNIPDYVLATDLDFVPPFGGYPRLMALLKKYPDLWGRMRMEHQLLVLPAIDILHIPDSLGMNATALVKALNTPSLEEESNPSSTPTSTATSVNLDSALESLDINEPAVESDLPLTKEELKVLFERKMARNFRFSPGHERTSLNELYWYGDQAKFSYPALPSKDYEPYFVGYKPDLPHYWTAFRGRGLDRQSWFRECVLAGFRLEVVFQDLYLTRLVAQPFNDESHEILHHRQEWMEGFQPYLETTYQRARWMVGDWFQYPRAEEKNAHKKQEEEKQEEQQEKEEEVKPAASSELNGNKQEEQVEEVHDEEEKPAASAQSLNLMEPPAAPAKGKASQEKPEKKKKAETAESLAIAEWLVTLSKEDKDAYDHVPRAKKGAWRREHIRNHAKDV